jgi:hypothetical protein
MKPPTILFISLANVLFISVQAPAQPPPYPVLMSPVVYSDMTTIVLGQDLTFEAYFTARPGVVITEDTVGCIVGDGFMLVELSELWPYAVGETLAVNAHGAGSNYPQPEDRQFLGILADPGIEWITELGPSGEFYLPVELTAFWAKPRGGTVTLRWATRSEVDNAGYNLFRATSEDGAYQKINARLIPGAGTTTKEHTYHYVDHPPYPSSYFYRLESVSTQGEVQVLGTIEVRMWRGAFRLCAASPSPLVENTKIAFELPVPSSVSVVVYDLSGRAIQTLHRGDLGTGLHECVWDGRDARGQMVGNGIYFVRMDADNFQAIEKVVVLR